jgi:hypothetical protein
VLAFLFVIAIFLFWAAAGFAIVSALGTRQNLLQNCLLAPVTGMAVTVILVLWLNCAGLPVRYAGPITSIILTMGALYLLRRLRPVVPLRQLRPFAGAILLSTVATGFPMLWFGFNWVSYCNDDMANYCLGAKFFLNHAHFPMPRSGDVLTDRDPSLLYWGSYSLGGVRHGIDELLAWACSLTGLSPHQAYMPLILAFQLALVAAAGALVLWSKSFRRSAALTCVLIGLCSLVTLGTLYQLLGQVSGLALLCGCAVMLLRKPPRRKGPILLSGILLAALGMMYPEALPFVVLSFVLYHGVRATRERQVVPKALVYVSLAGGVTCLLLNIIGIGTALTLFEQLRGLAPTSLEAVQFPYFLTPAGFAYFWGFRGMGEPPTGVVLDIGVILGAFLFLVVIAATVWLTWRGLPVAFVCFVMLVLAFRLFVTRSDFGLFKLAMFVQPFMLGTLCVAWGWLMQRFRGNAALRRLWILALIAVVGFGMKGFAYYTISSMGYGNRGPVELPYASAEGLLDQLQNLQANRKVGEGYLSDTSNVVLAKFQALYDRPVYFPAQEFFHNIGLPDVSWNPYFRILGHDFLGVLQVRNSQFVERSFDMHGALPSSNRFVVRRRDTIGLVTKVIETPRTVTIVNRRSNLRSNGKFLDVVPLTTERNHLLFIASQFGNTYYGAGLDRPAGRVSMYRVEDDSYYPGETMASLGRDSLFRILNPSQRVRLVVEFTATLNGDRRNTIPDASVIGSKRLMLSSSGRGSARLFSDVIDPQWIEREPYIMLDMGTWGFLFPNSRSWITGLWGTGVRMDPRHIVGFSRDISLISDHDYLEMSPPSALLQFPKDLRNPALEYSGLYEDGWTAEAGYVVLKESAPADKLALSLMVPRIGQDQASSECVVSLDGVEVARRRLNAGTTSFELPVKSCPGCRHKVELHFDRALSLPAPDGRPVSALVRYIRFRSTDLSNSKTAGVLP